MKANNNGLFRWGSLLLSIFFIVAAGLIYLNRQFVVDQISVWRYTPSSDIVELANRVDFTDKGRFYFYTAHPKLDGTSDFNNECKRREKKSAILGCYNHNTIFIYDIDDSRLDGIRTVTAAHETLHVAYKRLTNNERKKINGWLEEAYSKIDDKTLKTRLDYYARTEPGERDNELHSILGTEYKNLSNNLEKYYSQYFNNRDKIVDLHHGYKDKFDSLSKKREDIYAKLHKLEIKIKSDTASYNSNVSELNSDIKSFNSKADNGGFLSQDDFDSKRATLVKRGDSLSNFRDEIKSNIDEYNELRLKYNKLVDKANSLNRSLDSTLAPAPDIDRG